MFGAVCDRSLGVCGGSLEVSRGSAPHPFGGEHFAWLNAFGVSARSRGAPASVFRDDSSYKIRRIPMVTDQQTTEIEVLQVVIDRLSQVDDDSRARILQAASTFFGLGSPLAPRSPSSKIGRLQNEGNLATSPPFSDREELSAKEFLVAKEPKTEIERVACLGFYLTHYRDTPHFKTADITNTNTEAAQRKFSNPAQAVANATKRGLLVPAPKGNKQLSAPGERFVQALPDREAAREVEHRLTRKRRKQSSKRKKKSI